MKGQYTLTEEQEMFRQMVRRLAREKIAPRAAEIDETGKYPEDLMDLFRQQGLIGVAFPEEYGGGGADEVTYILGTEELAKVCVNSVMWCGTSHLGAQPILIAANEEQKRRFLPAIASGEKYCSFALTEPGAGSDVASISTTAVLKGDHYILNGTKCFCTGGNVAGYITVFARTDPTERIKGLSALVFEKGLPGFKVGKLEKKMGLTASPTAEIIFEDCPVPKENLLGKPGDGFKIAMMTLDVTRPTVAAASVGIAQGALDYALEYAKQRVQFGQPIAYQQAIQFMLADMAIEIEAARQLTYKSAALVDERSPQMSAFGAMAKCFASDVAMKVTTDAVQVLGGYGYMKDHPVERMMRDAKIHQIFEGTNQIQRIVVANSLLRGR